jgi:uncharacterized membrane protein YgcG
MKRLVVVAAVLTLTGPGLVPPDESAIRVEAQSQPASAATSQSSLKPDELDRLLAPIALYPDALLAQMLQCAQNPAKVAALHEWLASNKSLTGTDLQDAAVKAGFEPSFVALVLFPSVVQYMAEQMQWTTALGKVFTANRSSVFESIQRLRTQAQANGKLKTTAQQEVETKTTSSGQQVIVIEPANPQVVYVPQYNPQTVYTTPAPTTVVVQEDDDDADEAVAAGLIGFTAGIAMGAAMDNDYYYGPYGWHGGAYMYNDAWDDYYDHREDAREDWADHREDLSEERTDRARTAQEQRTERTEARSENRPQTQAQADARRAEAQSKASQAKASGATTQGARGYSSSGTQSTRQRTGTSPDTMSGYSSGKSERSASQRGQASRSSAARSSGGSRGGGGRGGGGRRR